ncbi:MAG: hypothetical protein WC997_00290 [Porticoccaceae bacterium]
MGCCIVGAIVFSFIFALWRRIGALLGVAVPEHRASNPAMWRLGESGEHGSPVKKLPLISPRFAAALAGGAMSIILAFWVVDHAEHIRMEVACVMYKTGVSAASAGACEPSGDAEALHH